MFTYDEEELLKVTVVTAGSGVGKVAERLRTVPAIIDYINDATPADAMSRSIARADIAIIASGFESEAAAERALNGAQMARGAESCQVVLCLVASSAVLQTGPVRERLAALGREVDALFVLSRDNLVALDENAPEVIGAVALEGYLVRQIVADILTMISERGPVCVDFADVRAIMCDGSSYAGIGIGLGGGDHSGTDAAKKAMVALGRQFDPAKCPALLVTIAGSTNITMDDFDAASRVIHDAIDPDANIIIGLLTDDTLAGNIRVTVMAKGGPVQI